MKKNILSIILVLSFITVNAQDYRSVAATVGLINTKARVQYEHQIKDRITVGAQLTYYFVNWTGPKLEVFGRLYSKKSTVEEGFFLQGKIGYGNLSVLEQDQSLTATKRWSTIGIGAAYGWKYMFSDKLGIETLAGLHFYSSPNYIEDNEDNSINGFNPQRTGETLGWYATTGLPVDFQLKLVYKL